MADEFPPKIDKYKVMGIIAKGGMGVVYKAYHNDLKRYFVIKKLISKRNKVNSERFKREADILMDLRSPYIVSVNDYFLDGGFRYMIEEFVDGMAIDKLIKKQSFIPCPVAMLIMQDACFALKYAHSKKVIHRDIKPGNILVSKRGEVKLTDFGIASDEAERSDNLTTEGMTLGTPAYMPPEQFDDSSSVDNRADIYALGITLYEMLTGTKPYSGEYTKENIAVIKKGKFIKPRKIDKTIPREVESLICRMIKSKKSRRIKSIDQVQKEVRRYLKHFDTHQLRVELARSVANEKQYEFIEKSLVPKDKTKRIIIRSVLGAAAAIVLFGCLWSAGLIHRTILSKWYSPIKVEMDMPVSVFKNGKLDLPIIATFYENDGNEIPEVKGSEREFKIKGSRFYEKIFMVPKKEVLRTSGSNTVYNMKTLYLKNGSYRIKIVVGPYIRWRSFTVTDKEVLLKVDFLKNMHRELKIHPFASDKKTGRDITALTNFEILYQNKWTQISEVPQEKLFSGTVWKIRASADGYNEEIFSLLIDWYQDELFLTAELEKK